MKQMEKFTYNGLLLITNSIFLAIIYWICHGRVQKYLFKTVSDGLLGYGKYNIYIYPNYDMNVFTIKISRIGLI